MMALLPPSGLGSFRVVETSIVLGASAKTIAANSANRIALFFAMSSGTGSISTLPTITNTTGIQFSATTTPVEFWWSLHAALVNQQWYGVSSGAGTITVIEVFYLPNPTDLQVKLGDPG